MNANLVAYSRLEPSAIKQIIISHYPLSEDIVCEYYVTGLHDNYLISDGQTKTILRIYRNSWRSEPEIRFELELLLHLNKQITSSVIVAAPILTKDKKYMISIDFPEATRYATLFPFIAGNSPNLSISNNQSKSLGKTIATIHLHSVDFKTQYHRDTLNLKLLLDESVKSVLSSLTAEQQSQLINIQEKIHREIPSITFEAPFACYCTGDVNATNFHINNNHITVFDFDQCGYGLRCFEIGKFFSYLLKIRNPQRISELQQNFLTGYQSISVLDKTEHQAIPFYICISIIWVMAIHIRNVDFIGSLYLDKQYWESRMALLINNLPPELL